MTKKRVLYRLLHILLVVIGVSFLSFLLMYAAPGDPVRAMYAVSGSIPPEEVLEQTREEMGLNDPFLVQYVRWAAGCLRGDFGTSYSQGLAVSGLLLERVWPTVQLALLSLVMMVALAVPIGMFSALRQNTRLDYLLRGITFNEALRTRCFEPDPPNYTPRISGLLAPDGSFKLSILKSADGNPDCNLRFFYEYDAPLAGEGRFIHTYQENADPLPSFEGEPRLVAITAPDAETLAGDLWLSLNDENKVSLFVRYIDLETGDSETSIINKHWEV